MTAPVKPPEALAKVRPITIAILAMGGEGGGVLAEWIVDLAEHGGYLAQMTSVPGVAQRTGATIYYVELFPKAAAEARGRAPILALMPVPGDVDVVVASELMEAGRAVQRGFVTTDRTTLVASTHRVYAMTERLAMADGRVDDAALLDGCRAAAKRLIAFDMASLAEATGSVISAVLFGALAGSGALPFPRAAFEAAIRRGGVGVPTSLAAFKASFEAAQEGPPSASALMASGAARAASSTLPPPTLDGRDVDNPAKPLEEAGGAPSDLLEETGGLPEPARSILHTGLARVADYQNVAYARLYWARIQRFIALEREHGDGTGRLLGETARNLALAMTYEDTIRVAELKIRPERFARVRDEARLADGQILEIAEFMHPRVQEIADTLPAATGRWLLRTGWAKNLLARLVRSGRVVKTSSVGGFLLLYLVASLKPLRRRTLRWSVEQEGIDAWLRIVAETACKSYALAAEVAECRGLVKGYGETHERGRKRFEQLMAALPKLSAREDAAARLDNLRKAANADETGETLNNALAALTPR